MSSNTSPGTANGATPLDDPRRGTGDKPQHLVITYDCPFVWVEGLVEAHCHLGKVEVLFPERAREHRVAVADDGTRQPVEVDDVVEEGLSDGDGGVGMAEGDEMRVLGEAADDGDHLRLAIHTRKPLDEVHDYVGPHGTGDFQRLQQTRQVQMLHLVLLAGGAALDVVPNQQGRIQRWGG